MEEDIYYIDTRNADLREHRLRPGGIVPTRTMTLTPASSQRVVFPSPSPMIYAQPPAAPVYSQPAYGQPAYGQQPFFSPYGPFGVLNGLTLGNLVDIGGKLWAAFKALPAMPTPTGDPGTDIANSILFQNALSNEQKGEKKIEAVSSAIAELLGAR